MFFKEMSVAVNVILYVENFHDVECHCACISDVFGVLTESDGLC